jgi:hypothetical protein
MHRHLINLVDQRVGDEKRMMRAYIAEIDRKLRAFPDRKTLYARWRKESGQV